MCGIVIGERFELREVVGRGGMGCVWRAYDRSLRREVALKESDVALREARAAAQVNHPNSVRILDLVDTARRPWIVMEHVPSLSLRDLTDRDGPLSPGYVASIGVAVLDALTAAHRAGVMHRDVKPGNILVGHDGRVVLTDFGIAHWNGASSAGGLGTPQYIAPERVSGNVSLPEGDLYSLGATLYSAVEGRGPYDRDTVEDTLGALLDAPPDPPRSAHELAPVLAGLLHRDPFLRWRPARVRRELLKIARTGAHAVPRRGLVASPVHSSTIAIA